MSLTFTQFNIHGNCDTNFISLADGLNPFVIESSQVQNTHCGSTLPAMYTSRSAFLTVVLNTTSVFNAHFRAVYTSSDNGNNLAFLSFSICVFLFQSCMSEIQFQSCQPVKILMYWFGNDAKSTELLMTSLKRELNSLFILCIGKKSISKIKNKLFNKIFL